MNGPILKLGLLKLANKLFILLHKLAYDYKHNHLLPVQRWARQ